MERPTAVEPVKVTLATSGCDVQFGAHHLAAAVDDVEHAGRQAGLVQGLGENLGLDGAHLAGLDDDGAAGGQRGRKFAADGADIAIPRADGGHDAHRLQGDLRAADGLA